MLTRTKANQQTTLPQQMLHLEQGPTWSRFEDFRTQGGKALAQLKEHSVGTLLTRQGQFRLMHDSDFQELLGLAREVSRLKDGLTLVLLAAQTVQKHPQDESALQTLSQAVLMLGNLPVLPTRQGHEPFTLDASELDLSEDTGPEGESETDPNKIERPLG